MNRYDGESFTHFTTNEGLLYNGVEPLLEDEKGNLWLGTDGGGLNYFDRETLSFKHFTHREDDPQSISSNAVLTNLIDEILFELS